MTDKPKMSVAEAFREAAKELKEMSQEEFLKLYDEVIKDGSHEQYAELERFLAASCGEDHGSNKERWKEICAETKKCPFCPKHDRENRGRRPRSDKHKNRRTRPNR